VSRPVVRGRTVKEGDRLTRRQLVRRLDQAASLAEVKSLLRQMLEHSNTGASALDSGGVK